MNDPAVLAQLRAWAAEATEALEMRASICRDNDSHDAAEVASSAARQFELLADLLFTLEERSMKARTR